MWSLGFACGDNRGECVIANFIAWPLVGVGVITTGIVVLANRDDVPEDANRAETIGLAPVITPDPTGRPRATGAIGTLSGTF